MAERLPMTDAGQAGPSPGLAGAGLRAGLAHRPGAARRPGHGGNAPGPDDDHRPGASAVPVAGDVPGPGWGLRAAFGWRAGKPESGPGGRSRLWRSLFSGVWLLYLVQPATAVFRHHGWAYATGGAVVIGTFCVVYMLVVSFWDRSVIQARAGFAALFALAIAITWAYHGNGSWIFVAAAAGLTIGSPLLALRVIGGVVACYTIVTLASGDDLGDFAATLLPVALVGLAMIGFRRQIELTRDLMRARETVARLAASEERLRLARDMHDLTGQSLSMITLKSDLAARLLGRLPQSADRDRAAGEIRQVADVSRQTLHDIREAISGYRRPTLAVEVITAREALEAAGIAAHDDNALIAASGTFDAGAEAVLAWCLREAVTNVIRHSGARDCWMRLTGRGEELCLDVRDNGARAGQVSSGDGTGLHGMSERLCAVGGKLELHPGPGGFRLVATVPAPGPAAGPAAGPAPGPAAGPGGPGPGGPRA